MGFFTQATLPIGAGVFKFNTPYEVSWCELDNTHILICYNQKNPNYFIGQVIELNGNNPPILYTPTLIESNIYEINSLIPLNSSQALLYVNNSFKILTINSDWSITPGTFSDKFDTNVLTPTAQYYYVNSPSQVIFGYEYTFIVNNNNFSGNGYGIKWININIAPDSTISFTQINDTPLSAEISSGNITGSPIISIGNMTGGGYFIISASDMNRPFAYHTGDGAWFCNIYDSTGTVIHQINSTPTVTLTETKKVISLSVTKLMFLFDQAFIIYNADTGTWTPLIEYTSYNNRLSHLQDAIRLDDNHIMAISKENYTKIYIIRNNYDLLGVLSPNSKFGLHINNNFGDGQDVSTFLNRFHVIDDTNILVMFRTYSPSSDTYNIGFKIMYLPP